MPERSATANFRAEQVTVRCPSSSCYEACEFPTLGAPSGDLAFDFRSDEGATNVLPFVPTFTALWMSCRRMQRCNGSTRLSLHA